MHDAESANSHGGLDDVFRHVEAHRNELVSRLAEYVRQPSVSATGEGMSEAAERARRLLEAIDLDARVAPTAKWPVVLGKSSIRPNRLTVLVYGHYDVQPPDPIASWTSPPFEPAIRDGRLYGRGSADNKGQHLAQILAMEALTACRGELPCNVIVLLDGEEEIGSPSLPTFASEHRDELAADLVVWSDGPVDDSGRWRIIFGTRGCLMFELRARGANRPLHSGLWGNVAPNPLWTLIHLLGSMKNERGEITIGGFYDDVQAPNRLEVDALRRLPVDIAAVMASVGLERLDTPLDWGYWERVGTRPALTINGLHGGYGGSGTQNVLPEEAVAKCEVRLVDAQRVDDIFTKIRAHVRRHAPEVEVRRVGGSNEPSKTPLDSPYTQLIRRGMVDVLGEEPLLAPMVGGTLPLDVFTGQLGLPTFGLPFANPDEANHAPDENLDIDRFLTGIKIAAAVLCHLPAGARPQA